MKRAATRRGAPSDATAAATLYRICSVLLRYPDRAVLDLLDDVDRVLPTVGPDTAATVGRFLAWLRAAPPDDAAAHYVDTFDHSRRRSLYLTYYRYGDTRNRGMALLTLKHVYRQAGYPPPEAELPDFLPLMLEFAALAPEPGARALAQCRAGMELLRGALHDAGSPYRHLIDALCARLPALGTREHAELRRLAVDGPPVEQVGLEPFAPPEFAEGRHP
ncbi:MAG TPA: nitrate reductase molybdenum cofactor assembly chaperone [Micromonosporaceae bacterium]